MNDIHAALVVGYMNACNTGGIAALESSFCEDVQAYFIDHPPVCGRAALAAFWARVHSITGARWTCDRVVSANGTVVVEWTEMWTPKGQAGRVLSRGVDIFEIRQGAIGEIRQFHRPAALPWTQPFEMLGFDYAGRGYPVGETFDQFVERGLDRQAP